MDKETKDSLRQALQENRTQIRHPKVRDTHTKAQMCLEVVNKNINDPVFVDWLFGKLELT
tara:strand:+ start:178 stop:357 length:180 start_codon:yes stop_codon:yes gene_type:complete